MRGSPTLVQTLVDIVSGNAGSRDTFAAILVRDMWSAIREREECRLPQNYGQLTIGTDVSPYLLDAIVSLYKTRWKLNKETSYADRAGIYLQRNGLKRRMTSLSSARKRATAAFRRVTVRFWPCCRPPASLMVRMRACPSCGLPTLTAK